MSFRIFETPRRLLYIVAGAFSLLLPFYTWNRLYRRLSELSETKLFHERHNCCVTYFNSKGFAGWPPQKGRLEFSVLESDQIFEPILYFLRTAKYSIDIAVMILNVSAIERTLCDIAKKGVVVRLLLDYDKCSVGSVQKLKESGIHVKMFINTNENTECLMHHKYVVKDFNAGSGFVLFGSLNWSYSGFINNYEDIVFTTNGGAVKSFHDNFESMWNYFDDLEKHDVITRAILNNKTKIV